MRKQLVSPTQEAMANEISRVLEDLGVTQAELARRAGVTAKHVNLVLSGKAGAQIGQLDYWAYLLGKRWKVTLVKGL